MLRFITLVMTSQGWRVRIMVALTDGDYEMQAERLDSHPRTYAEAEARGLGQVLHIPVQLQ